MDFQKYGVTVAGVLAAVGTVIGVIVSNLRAGLTTVAKGVGNGLAMNCSTLNEISIKMIKTNKSSYPMKYALVYFIIFHD